MVGLVACDMSPLHHPPPMSQTRPFVGRDGIKIFPISNGCQMSNNDPLIHHLVSSIFIAADPLKCHHAALYQEPYVLLAKQNIVFKHQPVEEDPNHKISVAPQNPTGLIIDL